MPKLHGEDHPSHKLTAEQVSEIRDAYTPGKTTQTQLAADYGITQQAVSQILQRRTWTRVPA